jgi:hypothetical protein
MSASRATSRVKKAELKELQSVLHVRSLESVTHVEKHFQKNNELNAPFPSEQDAIALSTKTGDYASIPNEYDAFTLPQLMWATHENKFNPRCSSESVSPHE